MSYSTPAQVRMALVPTSDGSLPNPASNTAADLSDTQLQDAIAEADSRIDAAIGRFYAVPVMGVVVPQPVAQLSATLTAGNVYALLSITPAEANVAMGATLVIFDPATSASQSFTLAAAITIGDNTASILPATAQQNFLMGDPIGTPGVATTLPSPIGAWSRDLAAYLATLTYRGSLDFTDQDPIARRYNDIMTALKAVMAGQMQLQIPRNVSDNAATGAAPAINPYVGDLWDPSDFNLRPSNFDPTWGPSPYWYDAWWMR